MYLRGKKIEKKPVMVGEAQMGNIKVTLLAERAKAGEGGCDKRI